MRSPRPDIQRVAGELFQSHLLSLTLLGNLGDLSISRADMQC